MKQDTVKKSNLCRKCLKLGFHSVQNCYGDPYEKCGEDHHTLICPNPRGEQAYLNLAQPMQSLYPDDNYGAQNPNYVLTNGVIGDDLESLEQIVQDMGYERALQKSHRVR